MVAGIRFKRACKQTLTEIKFWKFYFQEEMVFYYGEVSVSLVVIYVYFPTNGLATSHTRTHLYVASMVHIFQYDFSLLI